MRIIHVVPLIAAMSIASIALAATPEIGGQFVPIAPIPLTNGDLNSTTTLVEYLNGIFQLAIGIGAIAAVFRIAQGGYMYLLRDASVFKAADGKSIITNALKGLLLLLLTYIILFTINPKLVELDALKPSPNFQTQIP